MGTNPFRHAVMAIAILALALAACGGKSGGGGVSAGGSGGSGVSHPPLVPASIVVSGTVSAPGGAVALLTDKSLFAKASDLFFSSANAAISGIATVPDGTRVDLIRIDDTGAQTAALANTTTTGGKYSLDLPGLGLMTASDLVVQISSSTSSAKLRAFVTSASVNIDPASEATVRLVLEKIAAVPGASLKNFTVRELDDLGASVFLVLGMQGATAGFDIETTATAFKNIAAADSNLASFLTAASATGESATSPGDVGNYFPLSQGMNLTYPGTVSSTGRATFAYENVASIGGATLVGGMPATIFNESNPSGDGPLSTFFSKSDTSVTNLGNSDPGDIITAQVAPYMELPLPLKVGSSFEQIKRTNLDWGSDLDGDGIKESFDAVSTVSVSSMEKVTVEAGEFFNAVKVDTAASFTITLSKSKDTIVVQETRSDWYAPGFGRVKSLDVVAIPSSGFTSTDASGLAQFTMTGESRNTAIRTVTLSTSSIVSDPLRKVLYASVPSSSAALANTVTEIDPLAGTVGASISVEVGPGALALSDNSQYLYVGVNSGAAVQRVDIAARAPGTPFQLGSDPTFGPLTVEDMAVLPGSPGSIAVSRQFFNYYNYDLVVYDDGVARPAVVGRFAPNDEIRFSATASRLYGIETKSSGASLSRMSVDASGVRAVDSTRGASPGGAARFDRGLLFGVGGGALDPETLSMRGAFPMGDRVFQVSMIPDTVSSRVYFLVNRGIWKLIAYDRNTFAPLGMADIPALAHDAYAFDLVRWGTNGVAFRTLDGRILLVTDNMIQ